MHKLNSHAHFHYHYHDMTACVVPMCLQVSPMKLSYSTQWEQYLTQEIVDEMVGGTCCYWIPSCVQRTYIQYS